MHRSGRTGRAGKEGLNIVFCSNIEDRQVCMDLRSMSRDAFIAFTVACWSAHFRAVYVFLCPTCPSTSYGGSDTHVYCYGGRGQSCKRDLIDYSSG